MEKLKPDQKQFKPEITAALTITVKAVELNATDDETERLLKALVPKATVLMQSLQKILRRA